jgi:hypothetical protein
LPAWRILQFFSIVFYINFCSPVYPEEEAEDENVVDDNQAAEFDLNKPDEDAIMVDAISIYSLIFHRHQCKRF